MILAALAAAAVAGSASAQDFFLGEVRLVGFNFCPPGTLPADGRLMQISENPPLYSLFGTQYGGNGVNTFGLPDLRGRSPIAMGQGPGLSDIPVGTSGGGEQVTLTLDQLPPHDHGVTAQLNGVTEPGSSAEPAGNLPANSTTASIYGAGTPTPMNSGAITVGQSSVGAGQPVETRSPFLAMQYCVVTQGYFPPRG